jgi:phenylacetate-coenzyme A ligase PaaK-like adenylate-forming protein
MAETFVSPQHVDDAVLEKAMAWFAQAREGDGCVLHHDLELESWHSIPFTRKADLRTRLRPYPESGAWIANLSSSGTTANPVVSPWSEADERAADTTMRAIHRLCPSIDGAQCAVIAPNQALAAAYFMCREIKVNGGIPHLIPPTDPETVCHALVDEGIEVVFSLPLTASRIGEYFRATRGGPSSAIRLVFCGGDVLSSARQAMLADMWDALVLNMFGCSELFGPVAGPGEQGRPLVWHCEPVAVEVLDPVTLACCGVGERGVMVLSTLWPKASPLLRYWTDDLVQLVDVGSTTGTFAFEYIGRPPSLLCFSGNKVPLRDVDHALLSGGWCTSEWSIQLASNQVLVEIEMARRQHAALQAVREVLNEIVGAPVEVVPLEPGSLPRAIPKFAVRNSERSL